MAASTIVLVAMSTPDTRLTIDSYVIDSLMPDLVGHDRRASAFIAYLYLWRKTNGGTRGAVVSHQHLSDGTGLSKRGAQLAIATLARRRLVQIDRTSSTAAARVRLVREWRS